MFVQSGTYIYIVHGDRWDRFVSFYLSVSVKYSYPAELQASTYMLYMLKYTPTHKLTELKRKRYDFSA